MAVRGWSAHGTTVVVSTLTDTFAIVRNFNITQSRTAVDVTPLSSTNATRAVPSGVVNTRVSVSFVWDPSATENPIVAAATYSDLTITLSDGGSASQITLTAAAASNTGIYVESCSIDAQPDGTYEGSAELVASGAVLTFSFNA